MTTDAAENRERSAVPSTGAMVVLAAGMAAAWMAGGSIGLLAVPLRHALTWIALGTALVGGWPRRGTRWSDCAWLAAGVVVAIAMTASSVPAINVLAVAVVLAMLARVQSGSDRRVVLLAAVATSVLGIYHLAYTSIPTVWLLANGIGRALGWLAGVVTGQPLWIGATLAGVDFLVLSIALYVGWLIATSSPRLHRAVYAAAAILAGHFLYLVVLAHCRQLLDALPDWAPPPPSPMLEGTQFGIWTWGNAAHTLLPWNLPVLLGVIHVVIAVAMFRWASWPAVEENVADPKKGTSSRRAGAGRPHPANLPLGVGTAVLAIVAAVLIALAPIRSDLEGKAVLAYEQGYLNWIKPTHDSPLAGTYGMLPVFVESLGGEFVRSNELSQEELDRADVVLLIHPAQPWPEDRLQRLWDYVEGGGSLLLVAEPAVHAPGAESSFNEVLRPTAMQVRYDTAVSATRHWQDSLDAAPHPATMGLDVRRHQFGLSTGSSIRTRWPARPLLVGRYGYSDPGSDASNHGGSQYDPGEKLGDLVLAAEQRLGKGTVVVLGDTAGMHNETNAWAFEFNGRLLAYLAGKYGSPQTWWRQLLSLAAMVGLIVLLAYRADPWRLAGGAVLLSAVLWICMYGSHEASRVLPDGREHQPNNVAYIDASHLEAYDTEPWGSRGVAGLTRVLMRNGYLPLMMPEFSAERLERAELLISIGPAQPFSAAERTMIDKWIQEGGTFIAMVGAEHEAASHELLADFGFRVPPTRVPPGSTEKEVEPVGLGAFRQTFTGVADEASYMTTYAAWEVECNERSGRQEMVYWSNGNWNRPIVISRRVGRGWFVVVGDTFLGVNGNLESPQGANQGNVNFWRWLLSRVTPRQPWAPPRPSAKPNTTQEATP